MCFLEASRHLQIEVALIKSTKRVGFTEVCTDDPEHQGFLSVESILLWSLELLFAQFLRGLPLDTGI